MAGARLGMLGLSAMIAADIMGDMPDTKEGWEERFKENRKRDGEFDNKYD